MACQYFTLNTQGRKKKKRGEKNNKNKANVYARNDLGFEAKWKP